MRSSFRRLLGPLSLIAAFGVLASADMALAAPVHLICQSSASPGNPNLRFYVTVDYGANLVTISHLGDPTPITDSEGHAAFPATISQSQIAWQYRATRRDGVAQVVRVTINRLTGSMLMQYGNDAAGGSFDCAPGETPKPKF